MKKRIKSVAFITIGIIAIIFAIVFFVKSGNRDDVGSYESYKTYGGDAYTGIQNAAAQTANNVYYTNKNLIALYENVSNGFGAVFFISGLTFITLGTLTTMEKKLKTYEDNSSKLYIE